MSLAVLSPRFYAHVFTATGKRYLPRHRRGFVGVVANDNGWHPLGPGGA